VFAKRNSLTIAIIWLILLVTGSIWYVSDLSTLDRLRKEIVTAEKQLATSQSNVRRLTRVETIHREVTNKWHSRPKRIITAEEPSTTISYLYRIISEHNLNIYYDFVLQDKKHVDNVTKFNFTLSGEGPYEDIFKMVWFLTYEPILYKINALALRNRDPESGYLRFIIKLQGFSVDTGSDSLQNTSQFRLTDFTGAGRLHDVFAPLVRQTPTPKQRKLTRDAGPKLPSKLPGEINVEHASLKAVTNSSIFISEGSSGVKELRVGDKVYLGRLVEIDLTTNTAVFLLNKLGRQQRVTLSLSERN